MSGPVTDNQVGRAFIKETLGLKAHNARHDAAGLLAALGEALAGASGRSTAVPAGVS